MKWLAVWQHSLCRWLLCNYVAVSNARIQLGECSPLIRNSRDSRQRVGGWTISIPLEIAVYDLNGEVLVIDTLIRFDQSIEELLADAPHTGLEANFSWGVVKRTYYGKGTQTSGMTIDDVR